MGIPLTELSIITLSLPGEKPVMPRGITSHRTSHNNIITIVRHATDVTDGFPCSFNDSEWFTFRLWFWMKVCSTYASCSLRLTLWDSDTWCYHSDGDKPCLVKLSLTEYFIIALLSPGLRPVMPRGITSHRTLHNDIPNDSHSFLWIRVNLCIMHHLPLA